MKAAYGPFRRFRDRFRARRDGRRDGLLGIPTSDEVVYPPALLQIAHRANEALAALARGWAGEGARSRERVGAATRELRAAEEDAGSAAGRAAAAEQRSQAFTVRRDAFAAQAAPRAGGARISTGVYLVVILAIVAAEFPLNAIAFRLFGEAEVLTWVMTASLAVTLVLCAHGLGSFLRVEHASMAERRWILVLVLLPVLAIVAIALIRARYIAVEAETTGFDALGPVVGSLAFLVINLLLYTGATMLSYLAHAPRTLGSTQGVKEAESVRLDVAAARHSVRETARLVRLHEEQLSRAGALTEESLQVARAAAGQLVAYYRGLMAAYCAANLRARGAPAVPPVLRELPTIEVPELLSDPPFPGDGSDGGKTSKPQRETLRSVDRCPSVDRSSGSGMMARGARILAIVCLTLACCGFPGSGGGQDQAPLVVVLIDVSRSTRSPEVRGSYRDTLERIVDRVEAEHGTIVGDVIDDNPLAHSSYPIDASFDSCNPLTENRLECSARSARLRDDVLAQGEALLTRPPSRPGTDIHNGLRLAERVFDAYPEAQPKRLVVLSDMVERSPQLVVGRASASKEGTRSVLDDLARHGLVPDLAGVSVYVAGAGVGGHSEQPAERILAIERFWNAYFERAGSGLSPEHYGATLVRFP